MLTMMLMFIVLFIFIGMATGRTVNFLPIIFILIIFSLLSFGFQILGFLISNPWLFMILLLLYFIAKKNAPKRKTSKSKFYYYSSGTGTAKDFEDMFRQAGGAQYGEGGGYYNQNQTFGAYRDKGQDFRNLGIFEGATKEEIKKAYREKAKQHHPDRFVNATQGEKEFHEKMFKEINESYENLMKDFN